MQRCRLLIILLQNFLNQLTAVFQTVAVRLLQSRYNINPTELLPRRSVFKFFFIFGKPLLDNIVKKELHQVISISLKPDQAASSSFNLIVKRELLQLFDISHIQDFHSEGRYGFEWLLFSFAFLLKVDLTANHIAVGHC